MQPFIAALVVGAVVLATFKGADLLRNTIGLSKIEQGRKIVNDVVHYIEQTTDAPGSVKKEKALALAQYALRLFNIELEDKTVDLLIEAAVFGMNLILKRGLNGTKTPINTL